MNIFKQLKSEFTQYISTYYFKTKIFHVLLRTYSGLVLYYYDYLYVHLTLKDKTIQICIGSYVK